MTQLKTLKDIRFFPQRKGEIDRELKAEAVKWVKEKETMTKNDWINFFNLTEEDLK